MIKIYTSIYFQFVELSNLKTCGAYNWWGLKILKVVQYIFEILVLKFDFRLSAIYCTSMNSTKSIFQLQST